MLFSRMNIFFVILVLLGVTRIEGASDNTCNRRVPSCSGDSDNCSTCCCNSSSKVEFYNGIEANCTAPPAIYRVTLQYTLSGSCQPDLYNMNSSWSRPSVASHNSNYRMWDACTGDISKALASFSLNGDISELILEEAQQAAMDMSLIDAIDTNIFDGDSVRTGFGNTSINLVIDKDHPYVSSVTKLVSGPDYVVGVDSLYLCDGHMWKENVKVCFDLFSTGAASNEMRMNSVQENCSIGYIQFEQIKAEVLHERTSISDSCYPQVPPVCFMNEFVPIEECPTCCCVSSKNVEFYNPDANEPECNAPDTSYKVIFNFNWNEVCHPGNIESYSIFQPVWSWPIGVSHNTEYRMWDACMDNVSIGVGLVSQIGLTGVIVQEFMAAGANILDYKIGDSLLPPTGQFSQSLLVDSDHQWVSVISNRGPTPDQIVGVADLRLCDGDKWKENVKVCFELFSTAAASERVAPKMMRNSVQGNNCSFGYVEFKIQSESSTESVVIGMYEVAVLVVAALYAN